MDGGCNPGGLQSMGSLRVRHDWATSLSLFTFMHWKRKWQPTPVFLPGESQGQGSLVGCCLWDMTEMNLKKIGSSYRRTRVSKNPGWGLRGVTFGACSCCEGQWELCDPSGPQGIWWPSGPRSLRGNWEVTSSLTFSFNFKFCIGVYLTNSVVLVSVVQQSDPGIRKPGSILSQILFPLRLLLLCNIEQSSLCYIVGHPSLSKLHTQSYL